MIIIERFEKNVSDENEYEIAKRFLKFVMPKFRKAYPKLIVQELISVQPLCDPIISLTSAIDDMIIKEILNDPDGKK